MLDPDRYFLDRLQGNRGVARFDAIRAENRLRGEAARPAAAPNSGIEIVAVARLLGVHPISAATCKLAAGRCRSIVGKDCMAALDHAAQRLVLRISATSSGADSLSACRWINEVSDGLPRGMIYTEAAPVAFVTLAPLRAVALAGELIAAALPRLGGRS